MVRPAVLSGLWRWAVAFLAVSLLLAYVLGRARGLAGLTMGVVATTLSLYGWWPVTGMIQGAAVASGPRSPDRNPVGAFFVILIFVAKIPIFLALALSARWLGGAAVPCFLAGMGLVYLALIGWGLSFDARAE